MGLALSSSALATGTGTDEMPGKAGGTEKMSPEMRQKIASVHQNMADCLKSDRPVSECRSEMMRSKKQMKSEMSGKMEKHKDHSDSP